MKLHRLFRRAYSIFAVCLIASIASNASASASASSADHTPGLSQLGGWVYIDRNNDGQLAFSNDPNPEWMIGDALVSLYTKVGNVETFVSSTLSDPWGRYLFENIVPATYVLRQTQPVEYVDGIDTLGSLFNFNGGALPFGVSPGVASDNVFSDIVLTADIGGDYYNFGERGMAAGYASKRFLLGSAPGGNFAVPEPATLVIALIAAGGCCFGTRRPRRH